MIFLNPLGLLALIGIPVIILIYILRNKFNEQTVASTYLWELSEKFFKRRNPLSGITGLISLILQILTVTMIALAIARPVFIIPEAAGEYCFVLDGSGSMNSVSGGETLYERAKEEIEDVIDDASGGSTFTLINLAAESSVTYERLSDKKLAKKMLDELECSDGTVEYSDALSVAQKYFDDNPSFSVYLFTDKEVKDSENIEIVNVSSQNEANYAITNVSSSFMGGELNVTANVISYTSDAEIELLLYLDGSEKTAAKQKVALKAGGSTDVSLSVAADAYSSFRVKIDGTDALAADNEYISYNHKNETSYDVLLVSETPFFMEAALDVLTDAKVDVIKPEKYTGQTGYGLYIFQSYTPDTLPDAAVWLINSSENVEDSGFGARGIVETSEPAEITVSDSTSTSARRLLEGIDGGGIYVSEYVKYSGMYTRFTTLFSCGQNPLIFAGTNGLGNREVVIGFDLHKAHFSLTTDFVPLIGNLLEYSCPDIVESAAYTCGEDAHINITSQIGNIKAVTPDGEDIYIDTSSDIASFTLDKVGTYTVEYTMAGEERVAFVYSSAPPEESNPKSELESFSLEGVREYERTDGEFDPVVIIFIILALAICADWMVYCYEKYQLR